MPSRRQRPRRDRVEVPDAYKMLYQVFRLHCQQRHPMMRLRTREQHALDHSLHDDSIDHIHKEASASDGEQDQGPRNG